MITSINEWKRLNSKGKNVNENQTLDMGMITGCQPPQNLDPNPIDTVDVDTANNILKVIEYAKSLELTKGQTINVVNTVFVDPAQAPEEISVAFVQDHLGDIISSIEDMPDTDFAEAAYEYTADMEGNDLPFECAMYVPGSEKIQKLTETLNAQIKKNSFKAVYENGIFFINSLDQLNDNNKTVVLNILKECNAKNIGTPLKWKRKI